MTESLLHHAVAKVQNLLAAEGRAPLRGDAAARLEDILRGLATEPRSRNEAFEEREVTVLLADLRGFTSLTARYPPAFTLGLLNQYLAQMTEIVVRHGGTIDKFMGDAIMALFGAPTTGPDDAMRAVTCAVEMQVAMAALNEKHRREGVPPVYMGIGINTGLVLAGLLGSELFYEYTVIGEAVNLASRIESLSLRGQVLIGERTLACCGPRVRTGPAMEAWVKGGVLPLRVHEVLALRSPAMTVPRHDARRSPRVRVGIAARYRHIEGKRIDPALHETTIVDLGYGGLLLELRQPLALHSEIELEFDLAGPIRARNVCAKVRRIQHLHGRLFAGAEFTSMDEHLEQALRLQVQQRLQSRRLPVALDGAAVPVEAAAAA